VGGIATARGRFNSEIFSSLLSLTEGHVAYAEDGRLSIGSRSQLNGRKLTPVGATCRGDECFNEGGGGEGRRDAARYGCNPPLSIPVFLATWWTCCQLWLEGEGRVRGG
jgi:hypothetical protein